MKEYIIYTIMGLFSSLVFVDSIFSDNTILTLISGICAITSLFKASELKNPGTKYPLTEDNSGEKLLS